MGTNDAEYANKKRPGLKRIWISAPPRDPGQTWGLSFGLKRVILLAAALLRPETEGNDYQNYQVEEALGRGGKWSV
jgi:hypothetical protein